MKEQLIKYKLQDYPALKDSLENDKIVYLFGTGISSALTNKGYSWYKWIKDGAGYLPDDRRDAVFLKLEESSTAEHLVKIVGLVLELTKQYDVYNQWMKDSFESNPIEAMELKNTLAKIPVTQDIIATTNYDLLLEEATGLEMNTYQEPDKVFKMLDDRHSSSVIHIHGAYSSMLGVDNIIADEKQYSEIYNNQGAQFIQNLLGTRTLIFVGCGQTSDDINISRFIRFAKEHLKLEIPYFFITKEGNMPENLPDNFQVVVYGDAYSDLPVFLDEMVQHRLNHFMAKNPLVGRNHYQQPLEDKNGISKYYFAQEYIEFSGRKSELEGLKKFIYCKQNSCWWAITGQAGSGKSRLAYELMKQMPNNWFSCFLNDAVDVVQVKEFKPFSNMLLVIDYVRGRENVIAEIMLLLSDIFSESTYQLRILLLERDGFVQYGSWYDELYEKLGSNQKDKLKQYEYTSGIDVSNDLSMQPKTPFIKLVDLEEEAVLKLISQICKMNGLPEDSARDQQIKEAYGRKLEKLQYRPLFVQIYVEAWIDNGCKQVEFNGYQGLLQLLLQKEQKRWLECVDNNMPLLNSLIRLLIRACAGDGIDLNNLPKMYRSDWSSIKQFMKNTTAPGQQRKEHIDVLIRDVCQGLDNSELYMQPLYPDIVKEYMFEYYMEEHELPEVLDELWRNAGQEFGIYLQRCVADFPESQFFWNVLELSKITQLYNPYYLLARLGRLSYVDVKSKDAYKKMTNRLDVEFDFWSSINIASGNQFEINMVKMKALQMLSFQYGGWMKLDKMQECTELLSECVAVKNNWGENEQTGTSVEGSEEDAVTDEMDSDEVATILECVQLIPLMNQYAMDGFIQESEKIYRKIEKAFLKYPDNEIIIDAKIIGLNCKMMNALFKNNFKKAFHYLSEMEPLVSKLKNRPEELQENDLLQSALDHYANSCFNMIYFGLQHNQYSYMEKAFERLKVLHQLRIDDEQIAAYYLKGMVLLLYGAYEGKIEVSKIATDKHDVLEICNYIPVLAGPYTKGVEMVEALAMTKVFLLGVLKPVEKELYDKSLVKLSLEKERYPKSDEIAKSYMLVLKATREIAYNEPITKSDVDECYKLARRFPESDAVRETFLDILDASTERENIDAYGAVMHNLVAADIRENLLDDYNLLASQEPYKRTTPKVGRNDPCPCGSGKKYKKCCWS